MRRDVALVPGSLRGTRTVACPAPFRAVRGLRSVPHSFPLAQNWDCPLAWVPETAPVSKLGPLLRKQAGSHTKEPAKSYMLKSQTEIQDPSTRPLAGAGVAVALIGTRPESKEATQERSLQAVQCLGGRVFKLRGGKGLTASTPFGFTTLPLRRRTAFGTYLGASRAVLTKHKRNGLNLPGTGRDSALAGVDDPPRYQREARLSRYDLA